MPNNWYKCVDWYRKIFRRMACQARCQVNLVIKKLSQLQQQRPASHKSATRIGFPSLLVEQLAGHAQVGALVHQLRSMDEPSFVKQGNTVDSMLGHPRGCSL